MSLAPLLRDIKACTYCSAHLPLGPNPVVRASTSAKLLIIGQAPGTRVHESGTPWDDKSGERLRQWLNISSRDFYNVNKVAIMPMGFCYPGTYGALPGKPAVGVRLINAGFSVRQRDQSKRKGGDLPPRPECAPLWHDRLLACLPNIELTLLVGQYAQKQYLGPKRAKNLTQTVEQFEIYLPRFLPLPHPSWRTIGWQKNNPWFDESLLPRLRELILPLLV